MARSDPYAVLGVTATATQAQIKAAFRQLARELHPDAAAARGAVPDPATERRFKAIVRAYEAVGSASRRRAYEARRASGRFGGPGADGRASYVVEGAGAMYHSDLGHHSDFYQAGDPLSVSEAAGIVRRNPSWLRGAIRSGRLAATRDEAGRYLLRRRDVERLDRTARRRRRAAVVDEADARDAPPPDEAEA